MYVIDGGQGFNYSQNGYFKENPHNGFQSKKESHSEKKIVTFLFNFFGFSAGVTVGKLCISSQVLRHLCNGMVAAVQNET